MSGVARHLCQRWPDLELWVEPRAYTKRVVVLTPRARR